MAEPQKKPRGIGTRRAIGNKQALASIRIFQVDWELLQKLSINESYRQQRAVDPKNMLGMILDAYAKRQARLLVDADMAVEAARQLTEHTKVSHDA
jgi:hypothetical protein